MVKYIRLVFFKDNDGNYAPLGSCRESAVAASRCGGFGRSPSRVGLVKAKASNKTRIPPLQGVALIEAKSDFSFWEIIRVVPRIFSSLSRSRLWGFLFFMLLERKKNYEANQNQ